MSTDPTFTTELLNRFAAGDASLEDSITERIYGELHGLARAQLARARGTSLDPTVLVNEAWMRLVGREAAPDFAGRRQFFLFAAKSMRNLVVDRARAARSNRREEGLSLSTVGAIEGFSAMLDALDLEEALVRLERREPELARVAELRIFAGSTNAEAADVLDCSERTIERRWRFARAWLAGELANVERS